MAQLVKNLPAMQETWVPSLGWEDPLEKGRATHSTISRGFPGGSNDKESGSNAGDLGSIPGLGRPPGGGHGNPLQYSCLDNSMDREAWRAIVHSVTKGWTQLRNGAHMVSEGRLWLVKDTD